MRLFKTKASTSSATSGLSTDPYADDYNEIVWSKAHGTSVEPSSMYG